MPELQLSPGATLAYRDDDFTDPWRPADPVLLIHGLAESSVAWNGWMPRLGRRFRVIRPDLRGFGASTPMPAGYPWSADGVLDDLLRLSDALGIERFHLAGAKIVGGGLALRLAVTHPERVRSLTVIGSPIRGKAPTPQAEAAVLSQLEREGVEAWARGSMAGRLGAGCPPEMVEGWIAYMGSAPLSTQLGFMRFIGGFDPSPDLPRISCPVLAVTTEGSGMASVAETRRWQERIPRSELFVMPGDSYHVAATDPDACAKAMVDFIERCG